MNVNPIQGPTWQGTIAAYFSAPYWVPEPKRAQVAAMWLGCMSGYSLQLDSYGSVRQWSVLIFQYLHTREMPLTQYVSQQWPDEALEVFRQWVNEGWRQSDSDPYDPAERIPPPVERPVAVRIRRDLASLSQDELDDYRMRVDDAFDVANPDPNAPGQVFFSIHGDWCLHYQEAFLLWHRAYLMAFEQRIGCAVPYWNWYAQDAAIESSPSSGLPQAFRDETYRHPRTGEIRPNPLRYAAAKGGCSKACVGTTPPPPAACKYVQRDPVLYTTGDDQREARAAKIALTLQYQQQVQKALAFENFSHQQGYGDPWANIQSFNPPPPDSEYRYRDVNFDGAYEQPHDNYHGWVGPDMADNSYTAFDPVFWSYHSNIDRIFEIWLRSHTASMTVTPLFPLRPFAGARAERLEFTDPRTFVYTSIGDLAKDSRALGFDFGPPAYPDFGTQPGSSTKRLSATGLRSLVAAAPRPEELLVLFDGVRCTFNSYAVDVFLNQTDPAQQKPEVANPHYCGRMTRIGMGQADSNSRCIQTGIRRFMDVTATALKLGITSESPLPTLSLVVTDLSNRVLVPAAELADLPGFTAHLHWMKPGQAQQIASSPSSVKEQPRSCCRAPH